MRTFTRGIEVLKAEGVPGLFRRLRLRVRLLHSSLYMLVLAADYSDSPQANGTTDVVSERRVRAMQRMNSTPLNFERVLASNEADIDELTRLDPWGVPKEFTIEKLHDDWQCFVAKKDRKIVASAWVVVNDEFKDDYMNRRFVLGAGEAYYWRGFCVPDNRGRGILPRLAMYMFEQVKVRNGKTHHMTLVRTSNQTMQTTLSKIGWRVVGRAGFIDILGLRFHYLWGRQAFSATKKRFFLQLKRKTSKVRT